MKYTATLVTGDRMTIELPDDTTALSAVLVAEGLQWITDLNGIMLNMVHVAALVPDNGTVQMRDLAADPGAPVDDDPFRRLVEAMMGRRPRSSTPASEDHPARVRDGKGLVWDGWPDGTYTCGSEMMTLADLERTRGGYTVID